jgi:Glycosyl hydrolases family 16
MYLASFTLPTIALFASSSLAAYSIEDDYTPSAFASMFDFFTDNDPTSGYVNYISQSAAESAGLFSTTSNSVRMAVDSTNVAIGRGRDSIRISSKKAYNHGLVILDLAHMPGGQCGTWPAFWLLGPGWPNNGEIDIIEGVNSQTTNSFAGHTNAGCSITNTGAFSGTMNTPNCDVNAPGQGTNVGCAIGTGNTQSYGQGFNTVGGGVYATEWTSEAISVWFFPRSAIPSDLNSGTPNPDNWGIPTAQFTGGCNIDQHFKNQQIVFDITFCGQWAGQVWGQDATCAPKAATCQDYVQNTPSAFTDTYWSINSLKVYQNNGAAPPTTTAAPPTATTTATIATPTVTLPTTFSTLTSIVVTTTAAPPTSTETYTTTYTNTWPTTYTNTWPTTYADTWPATQAWTQPASIPTASTTWENWAGGNEGNGGNNGGWGGRGGAPGGRWGPPRA